MESMNEKYGWKIWMESMNEKYEWKIWMKNMNEKYGGHIQATGMDKKWETFWNFFLWNFSVSKNSAWNQVLIQSRRWVSKKIIMAWNDN